ncbi:MAG: arabinogalactan endo-1,4-beta-galactosidase [Bacteroidia bacterium]|nr:arabinogalactan endo-1,4-beta-galactosidase [Bacteroidia bacterium]MCF8425881.1 arabinogalactan endo-1,4-beta-galactosidase [Bacteroidia bacterium]MCF8445660.1 arabinogalactan endo-1,4-beta-galactosidase [Bacteroidia bacterium]
MKAESHYLIPILAVIFSCFFACKPKEKVDEILVQTEFIKAIDLSFLPQVRASNVVVKNREGLAEDMLFTLKKNGVNTVRLRLWVEPSDVHSGFKEVKSLVSEIKSLGLKIWLTVHYSDTWADPGAQTKPSAWKDLSFEVLKDSVSVYTQKIVTEMDIDYFQIGNEINNGMLWPDGSYLQEANLLALLGSASKALRTHSPKTKIMIHYAGQTGASYFFQKLVNLDYDIIGLSYYPTWHGRNLDTLEFQLAAISNEFKKPIVIAETSYPFTLGWNDWTNNVLGDTSQLIPAYPATPQGQKDFLIALFNMVKITPNGLGFCYWGGEWISFKGATSKEGSSYENQALWDFEGKALPAIEVFK